MIYRSGTHGLSEELGRHSTRNSSKACVFCESSSIRKEFISSLDGILQNDFHLKSSF